MTLYTQTMRGTANPCLARKRASHTALHAARWPVAANGSRRNSHHFSAPMPSVACRSSASSSSSPSPPDHGNTAPAASQQPPCSSLTERIFAHVDALQQAGSGLQAQGQGAGGRTTYAAFLAAEEQWARMRAGGARGSQPQFVRESPRPLPDPPEFDVVVCGGTLGVFMAAALAVRGLRVAVVERGPLRGREQEWNISRKELLELEHVGVATREELEACIAIEFNPVRVGFAWQPGHDTHATSGAAPSPTPAGPASAGATAGSSSALAAAAAGTAGAVTPNPDTTSRQYSRIATPTSTPGSGLSDATIRSSGASGSLGAAAGGGGFRGTEVWTRDVLNLGVRPDALVGLMRRKLESYGGVVLERTALDGISVHPNGCGLSIRPQSAGSPEASKGTASPGDDAADSSASSTQPPLTARLVLDCMGHFSPIVRQIRWGQRPDGVCLVVGSMATGFPPNTTADVILTTTPLQPPEAPFNRAQYFWEAFPAAHHASSSSSPSSARTTYMFTYTTAEAYRGSLGALLEDYWRLMPQYQGVRLEDIDIQRVLFGFFPAYKDTPLKPAFDRVLQVGDAGGLQSPLSFGGLAALSRHVGRLTAAITEAVDTDALDRSSLGLIASYNPGLSSSWMMQKAMSVRQGQQPPPQLINRMLAGNFRAMERLGDPVLKPFLQDIIQFGPMMLTLTAQMLSDPATIPALIAHVGPLSLLQWTAHMACMAAYTALHAAASLLRLREAATRLLSPRERYTVNRWLDAWEYGSGQDYRL